MLYPLLYPFCKKECKGIPKNKIKKRCKNNVLERFTKQCKLTMEPVGVEPTSKHLLTYLSTTIGYVLF